MFLGIEIGGTKLQLAVGAGDGSRPVETRRKTVQPAHGATGVLDQLKTAGRGLLERHAVQRIGIGFGGPVDGRSGRVVTSHQVSGWNDFPLVEWCREVFGLDCALANDCDAAALAEARFGAGRGRSPVFYVTVGSGIGGGLVIDGRLYGAGRPSVAEIGHLRPGPDAESPADTVEALASGWALAERARTGLSLSDEAQTGITGSVPVPCSSDAVDLRRRCGGDSARLTAEMLARAAGDGNEFARELFREAARALGWAIAQVVTLLAPELIIVGGGVSLAGEKLFFTPLREAVARYVFPPLAESYALVPARLGELVVVYGALTIAAGE